jgi:hypothetical protein
VIAAGIRISILTASTPFHIRCCPRMIFVVKEKEKGDSTD